MMNQTRVLVAEDHAVLRSELVRVIARDPRLVLVSEAGDGELAWRGIVAMRPELVLLDINLPSVTGLEIASRIRQSEIRCSVIVVTAHREAGLVSAVMNLGARGFVLKDDYILELPVALSVVLEGGTFISSQLKPPRAKRPAGLQELTPCELRLLQLLAEGIDTASAGVRLAMTDRSIAAIRDRICAKRQLTGEAELVQFARQHERELRETKVLQEDRS